MIEVVSCGVCVCVCASVRACMVYMVSTSVRRVNHPSPFSFTH